MPLCDLQGEDGEGLESPVGWAWRGGDRVAVAVIPLHPALPTAWGAPQAPVSGEQSQCRGDNRSHPTGWVCPCGSRGSLLWPPVPSLPQEAQTSITPIPPLISSCSCSTPSPCAPHTTSPSAPHAAASPGPGTRPSTTWWALPASSCYHCSSWSAATPASCWRSPAGWAPASVSARHQGTQPHARGKSCLELP